MAHIVFCWELGTGRGHLTPHLPVARHLREAGHEVTFAVRHLQHAETLLGSEGFRYLQAPTWLGTAAGAEGPVRTYPQVLLNVGFADAQQLVGRIRAWRALFELLAPDALVVDHGPTALLAVRGLELPAALIGSGFTVPPSRTPSPALVGAPDDATRADEMRVLGQANTALAHLGLPEIDQLADLFDVDLTVLQTFPELDPYPDRDPALYRPANPHAEGVPPAWPDAAGPRVFAYLKPGPMLAPVLTVLARRKVPTLVCGDALPRQVVEHFESSTLRISPEPFDMREVGRRCDVAVINAGHATVINLLLAGVPMVLAPQQLEQHLTASRVAQLGAGAVVTGPQQTPVDLAFEAALRPACRAAARAFAERHAGYDFAGGERDLAERIARLATNRGPGTRTRGLLH